MRNRSFIAGCALAGALLLLFLLPESLSRRLKGSLREGLAPLHELLSGTDFRLREAGSTVRGFGGLVGENRRMAENLIRLQEEVRRLEALQAENDALRASLGFVRSSPWPLVPAQIIARDVSGWWQTVRINRGRLAGIGTDCAVLTQDGLAGRTMDSTGNTAEVLLLSDPSCRVAVHLPRSDAYGILRGAGVSRNGQVFCRLELVNRNTELRAGDEVRTSGLGGVFPPGLPVGYVESFERDPAGLTQSARVQPHATLGSIRTVFVIPSRDGEPPAEDATP